MNRAAARSAGSAGRSGGSGIPLLEELVDHGGLGKHPAVLLDHGHPSSRWVLLDDPRRAVVEVDHDDLVRHLLLGEDDAHARAERAAGRVVQGQHR